MNVCVPLQRRDFLVRCTASIGGLAFAGMDSHAPGPDAGVAAASRQNTPGRARQVIFLFMVGGPSQVDTFDPKPRLRRDHGRPFPGKIEPTQENNVGAILASPWRFRQHGASGLAVSSLFPHLAQRADDLLVIRSMVSNFSEHVTACSFLHAGHGQRGKPSLGAWVCHALGSDCADLPAFIAIGGSTPLPGGASLLGSGFLPAATQASIFLPRSAPIPNLVAGEAPALQRRKLGLVRELDALAAAGYVDSPDVRAAIANQDLAERMQTSVPRAVDVSGESRATRALYGLDDSNEQTRTAAHQCLMARRLIERGVRFVEVITPTGNARAWDQHEDLRVGHENAARAVDQPIAALLRDLKERGLLDSTLVLWAGEFGRTPFAQGSNGRDHNPFGFTVWLAGAGLKHGFVYGATDEFGYRAVEDPVTIHDLHATMLHLLGLDHQRLTFRHGGRDMRLTDVHGHVVEPLLA